MTAWHSLVLALDKTVGRLLPLRFILFVMVGGSGIFVSLGVLWLCLRAGIAFNAGQAVAVVISMTTNFVLNNSITYRDRKRRGWAFLRGLLSFYLVCGVGAVANVGIATLLYSGQQVWWVAALAGAAAGAVWNYTATQLFTWRGA